MSRPQMRSSVIGGMVWLTLVMVWTLVTPTGAQLGPYINAGGLARGTIRIPAGQYLNFGTTAGSGGYGCRDNSGTLECKNSGGAWANLATGSFAAQGANSDITSLSGLTGGISTPTLLTFASGGAIRGTTTNAQTWLIQGYDTDTGPGYVSLATITNGTAPSLTFANPAGGGHVVWNGDAIGDPYISSASTWNSKAASGANGDITSLTGLTGGIATPTFVTLANAGAIRTTTTSGNTLTLSGYTGAAYTPVLTVTNAATPTLGVTVGSDATGDLYYRNASGVLTRIPAGAQNTIPIMGASSVPGWSSWTHAAPGPSGNVLKSDGTNWTSAAPASSGAVTLIGELAGTDTTATATTVASFAISGLTVKDLLKVVVTYRSLTASTAQPLLYHVTDGVTLAAMNDGQPALAASIGQYQVIFGPDQSSSLLLIGAGVVSPSGSAVDNSNTTPVARGFIKTVTTDWTAAWTLGLRHGGVSATGTFYYKISVYKIAGQ